VILDGEGADVPPAGSDVRDGILVLVIEHVPGVVANADGGLTHLCNDARAGLARTRIAAVLFDDDGDTGGPCARGHTFQVANYRFILAGRGFSKGQQERDLCRRSLVDAAQVDIQCVRGFQLDGREHHDRCEPHVTAAGGEPCRLARGSLLRQHPARRSAGVAVIHAPPDIAVSGFLNSLKRALHRNGRIGQSHAT
jgi:hypothetical protein